MIVVERSDAWDACLEMSGCGRRSRRQFRGDDRLGARRSGSKEEFAAGEVAPERTTSRSSVRRGSWEEDQCSAMAELQDAGMKEGFLTTRTPFRMTFYFKP